jgi:SAM-dependent methyltransferase
MALIALNAINHGDQHYCPICETSFARFMRRGGNLMCVGCRSFARHRLMVLYIQREVELLRQPAPILHIAPEPGVHSVLSKAPAIDNVTLDLESGADVQIQADARELPFGDGSFDAVLCSHVLEHIPEDVTVAYEMSRVLAPGGVALIQVPVDPRSEPHTRLSRRPQATASASTGSATTSASTLMTSRCDLPGRSRRCNGSTTPRPATMPTGGAWVSSSRHGEDIYVCTRESLDPPAGARRRG